MANVNKLAGMTAVMGHPARAAMLEALMDGRALTAGELAKAAGISLPTASGHMARLADMGLLTLEKQGRHRYHRLASPEIAHLLEEIVQVAVKLARPTKKLTVGPRDESLRAGRTCYDHLAGRLGVAITDALVSGGHISLERDGGQVTDRGQGLLAELGLAVAPSRHRLFCRPCLDWSERRPHLAGALGAAICQHCIDQKWIRRLPGTRAVEVTPMGRQLLRQHLGLRDL